MSLDGTTLLTFEYRLRNELRKQLDEFDIGMSEPEKEKLIDSSLGAIAEVLVKNQIGVMRWRRMDDELHS